MHFDIEALFGKVMHRKSVQNGLWLYVLQFFNTVIPLATIPYITRILGANEYGVFSIAYNLVGYFLVVVEYGFNMSGARKASLAKDIRELDKTFTSIIVSRFLLCVFCFIVAIIYGFIAIDSSKQRLCLLLLFLVPLGTVLQQNWLFQGLQKMKYIAVISVIARVISLITVFVFVKSPDDLPIYCISYSLTTVLIGIISTYIAIKTIKIRIIRITKQDIINEIKTGWYIFTTSFGAKIFNTFGITVLGILGTEYEVGIYSAILRIPQVVQLAWYPITQVLYPITSKRMTSSFSEGRKYVNKVRTYIFPVFVIGVIIIALFAKTAVSVAFGSEYEGHYYLIYPLLAWLLCGIFNNFTGVQTLLAGGYSKEYSKSFLIGVILTVVLNFLFTGIWGIVGCAFAPAISEFCFGILLLKTVKGIEKESANTENEIS